MIQVRYTIVYARVVHHGYVPRTERTTVKVPTEPPRLWHVFVAAVHSERRGKHLLGTPQVRTVLDLARRGQKVLEAVRHRRHLVLNLLEVLGDNVPDVLVRVLLGIVEVRPDALEEDRGQLIVEFNIQVRIRILDLLAKVKREETPKDAPRVVLPVGNFVPAQDPGCLPLDRFRLFVLLGNGHILARHERLKLRLLETQVPLDFRSNEHEPVVEAREPKLAFNVVRERPNILRVVKLFENLGNNRRLARPGDTLEERNHLPRVNVADIETHLAPHDVHPARHLGLKLLVLHDGLKVGRRNVPPVFHVVKALKVLVEKLGAHNRGVQAPKVGALVRVKPGNVPTELGAPLLAHKEAVVERPHVAILVNLGKLGICAIRQVLDGVPGRVPTRRQILPNLKVLLLLGDAVHKLGDAHHRLPRLGPKLGHLNLLVALALVPAKVVVVRFVERDEDELLVRAQIIHGYGGRPEQYGVAVGVQGDASRIVHSLVHPCIRHDDSDRVVRKVNQAVDTGPDGELVPVNVLGGQLQGAQGHRAVINLRKGFNLAFVLARDALNVNGDRDPIRIEFIRTHKLFKPHLERQVCVPLVPQLPFRFEMLNQGDDLVLVSILDLRFDLLHAGSHLISVGIDIVDLHLVLVAALFFKHLEAWTGFSPGSCFGSPGAWPGLR